MAGCKKKTIFYTLISTFLSIYRLAHRLIAQVPSREDVHHKCFAYPLQLNSNDPGSLNIILLRQDGLTDMALYILDDVAYLAALACKFECRRPFSISREMSRALLYSSFSTNQNSIFKMLLSRCGRNIARGFLTYQS